MSSAPRARLAPSPHENEIASLLRLSARVGADPLLVQASNGNTSIKLDGVLWIKASGKWLANATREEILVLLAMADVRDSIQHDRAVALRHLPRNGLRPSIETAMHAVLPHRVVLHVHSVNAIAWAVRLDGPAQLQERLGGLHWKWIPYAPSGVPLAREIARAVAGAPETDVLVLGNHGLVVCGNDCASAESLLAEVERRLAIVPRRASAPQRDLLQMIARSSPWRFPILESLHALGTDPVSLRILQSGILYPCQAVFLGATIPLLPSGCVTTDSTGCSNAGDTTRPFIVVEGSGVLVNENISTAERATLAALLEVVQRTEESAPLRYLTRAEITKVLTEYATTYKPSATPADQSSNPRAAATAGLTAQTNSPNLNHCTEYD
ncbi:MAG: class II aldolase/adducin family protein [Candidatus Acidiferrales bacterium]